MPRAPRIEYPGAVYHVMARGDGGRNVFDSDEDRKAFMALLAKTCGRCGWKIHAYVLMGNHFHLLLETPEPNLVDGMRWLMGVFALGWNKRRNRRGHVFQGRYKAVVVDSEDKGEGYFKIVADYIHLNPVRIGWVGGETGRKLSSFQWSSYRYYGRSKAPSWLSTERVMEEFQLSNDHSGGRSYTAYLEARAKTRDARENNASTAALRRGWALGSKSFKTKLANKFGKKFGASGRSNYSGGLARLHDTQRAEELAGAALRALGVPEETGGLAGWGAYLEEKALIASLLRQYTAASNQWIAERLSIGHPNNVSRMAKKAQGDKPLARKLIDIAKLLNCED